MTWLRLQYLQICSRYLKARRGRFDKTRSCVRVIERVNSVTAKLSFIAVIRHEIYVLIILRHVLYGKAIGNRVTLSAATLILCHYVGRPRVCAHAWQIKSLLQLSRSHHHWFLPMYIRVPFVNLQICISRKQTVTIPVQMLNMANISISIVVHSVALV